MKLAHIIRETVSCKQNPRRNTRTASVKLTAGDKRDLMTYGAISNLRLRSENK